MLAFLTSRLPALAAVAPPPPDWLGAVQDVWWAYWFIAVVTIVGEEFLPEQLRYLGSYFARRTMNPWFPCSVLVGGGAAATWIAQALAAGAEPGAAAGAALVGSLLVLAVLEHLFMVIPVSTVWIWRWGLSSHARDRHEGTAVVPPVAEPAILTARP